MTLTKADIRRQLIDLFNADENMVGLDMYPVLQAYIEREGICPATVAEVMFEMGAELQSLSNDRFMMNGVHDTVLTFSRRFSDQLWAAKHLHTGGIKCPKA